MFMLILFMSFPGKRREVKTIISYCSSTCMSR